MRSVQVTLAEVAYVIKSCQYLLDELHEVERVVGAITEIDPLQDSMVETAAIEAASAIKGQLDHAARVAEHWQTAIGNVLA
jgi:hypothetical protein